MSEVIIPPDTRGTIEFGLQVINILPVRLERQTPSGPVTAFGSAGDDSIVPTSADDRTVYNLYGNGGNDVLQGAAAADSLSGDAGDDSLSGGSGNDFLSGGDGNDRLDAGLGNDIASGGLGGDTIAGGLGSDILSGGGGNDALLGGKGNDIVLGEVGNDNLTGGIGDDTVNGGAGNDRLSGGVGNDLLIPGAGKDILTGGPGADTFRFDAGSTGRGQLDSITDFGGRDLIQLSNRLLRSSLRSGRLSDSEFRTVDSIGDLKASEQAKIIYERSTGLVYYNPTNGSNVQLFQMQKNLEISANDFEIF